MKCNVLPVRATQAGMKPLGFDWMFRDAIVFSYV